MNTYSVFFRGHEEVLRFSPHGAIDICVVGELVPTGKTVGDFRDETEAFRWWLNEIAADDPGDPTPEIEGEATAGIPVTADQLFFGGRNDNNANFEGKLDEVAIYDRALTTDEVVKLFKPITGDDNP